MQRVLHLSRETHRIFSGFIVGKIIDSFIIGVLCYIGMLILHMPFPLLIAVIVGVTNVIPFFGPFIGAIPSGLLILLVAPDKVLWFVIFVFVMQQFDGNILCPKIVGETTGISPIWVLFGIILGSNLLGFVGMIVGVPFIAVTYTLFRNYIDRKHKEQQNNELEISTTDC